MPDFNYFRGELCGGVWTNVCSGLRRLASSTRYRHRRRCQPRKNSWLAGNRGRILDVGSDLYRVDDAN